MGLLMLPDEPFDDPGDRGVGSRESFRTDPPGGCVGGWVIEIRACGVRAHRAGSDGAASVSLTGLICRAWVEGVDVGDASTVPCPCVHSADPPVEFDAVYWGSDQDRQTSGRIAQQSL